jgi:hypothetical protein
VRERAKLREKDARAKLLDEIARRGPWLELTDAREACVESDALDALLSALIARAAARGMTLPPPDDEYRERVDREGWIHLPTRGTLAQLL